MPSSMPARIGGRLRRSQLIVELPLQPAVKIDGVGVLGGEVGDRRVAGCASASGHRCQSRSVLLGERAPDREVVEAAPLAFAVRRVRQLAAGGTLDPVTFFSASRLACHAVSRSISSDLARCLQAAPVPCGCGRGDDVGEFRDRLDAQIKGVDEPARGGQVRRRLHRRGGAAACNGLTRMNPAPWLRRDHTARSVEIGQIADAPRLSDCTLYSWVASPHVRLPPSRAGSSSAAGATISGASLRRAGVNVQPVIAQRQVGGQLEGGFADQPVAEIVWGSVVLQLTQSGADAAVLQPDPQPTGSPWVTCTQNEDSVPAPRDDGRWQRAAPVVAVVRGQRGRPLLLGRRGHPECRQHGDQGGLRHVGVAPVQSSYSFATPWRRANSPSDGDSLSHVVSCPVLVALPRARQTSRINKSSQVSRRTTSRASPSRANTTGTRRAPLYWLDIV